MKGATAHLRYSRRNPAVSIHAPNEGSDQAMRLIRLHKASFNPRSQ